MYKKNYSENVYHLAIEVAKLIETEQRRIATNYVTKNRIILLNLGSEVTDI